MKTYLCVPKPSYLLSRLASREGPDTALRQVLAQLAGSYQLGEIRACHRAPRSNSLNFFVTTSKGKFVPPDFLWWLAARRRLPVGRRPVTGQASAYPLPGAPVFA